MYRSLNAGMVNVDVSFKELLPLAKKHKFGAVECDVLRIKEESGLEHAIDLMGQNGIILSSFGLPVSVQGNTDDFNSSFVKLESSAQFARALGCQRSATYIFSWHDELDFAENFKQHVYRLRLCAEVLEAYGITLALEFLGPKTLMDGKKYKFIHSLEGMLELCDAIGTGNMNILLDAYHCYTAGMQSGDFAEIIRSQKDIGVVHINDAPKGQAVETLPDTLRYLPGDGGAMDVSGFLSSLKKVGYTGPVVCEPFSEKLKSMDDSDAKIRLVESSFDRVWPD